MALTYGAYAGVGTGACREDFGGVWAQASEGSAAEAFWEDAGSEEHPVQVTAVRAVTRASPAAGFRRCLIAHAPLS